MINKKITRKCSKSTAGKKLISLKVLKAKLAHLAENQTIFKSNKWLFMSTFFPSKGNSILKFFQARAIHNFVKFAWSAWSEIAIF